MASWEWNVECCVCRAPFPASLTAQAHANDQYYWSTIDGLATKQEKLITTKALLSFNYRSSVEISAAQRHSPTLISNKMWCRWKKIGRWKIDKIIWLLVRSAEMMADLSKAWVNKRTAEGCTNLNWESSQNRILCDLGQLNKKVNAEHIFPKIIMENSQLSLPFLMSLNNDLKSCCYDKGLCRVMYWLSYTHLRFISHYRTAVWIKPVNIKFYVASTLEWIWAWFKT